MNKRTILSLTAIPFILMTGCAEKVSPKAVDLKNVELKMKPASNILISVKKGQTLTDMINKLQYDFPNKIILDKTYTKLTFTENVNNLTPTEFRDYLRLKYGLNIAIRKFSKKIYTIEEITDIARKYKRERTDVGIPNKNLNIKGEFTYLEFFNMLRKENINIFSDIYYPEKTTFSYDEKVPEFSGTLKEFLNLLALEKHLFVIVEKDGIRLKDIKTVTYDLELPQVNLAPVLTPNGAKTSISISSAASEGGGPTAVTDAGGIEPIKALEEQVKAMLGKNGTYSFNHSNGSFSVTGDYETIKITDQLVYDFHEIYGKSIKIELHIYEVRLNDDNLFGIDYSALKSEIVGSAIGQTLSLQTAGNSALDLAGTSSLTLSQFGNPIVIPGGTDTTPEETQSMIFKYLNQYGRTQVVTKPSLNTINNLPVRLDIIDSVDYVYTLSQTSNTTIGDTVGATTNYSAPEIRTITTGYSVILHPKTEEDFIKIAIKNIFSTLNGLTPYTYGDNGENVIYLKDVSAREFDQTVKIKEGEIAIIGGFMYKEKKSVKSGMPTVGPEDSFLDPVTSSKQRTTEKVEVVITVSAKVL